MDAIGSAHWPRTVPIPAPGRAALTSKGATIIPDLTQIIYASQPFGYDSAILSGILLDARRNNMRDTITGALVCRQDIYLQLLEGPTVQVEAAFQRICRDDRHVGINKLIFAAVPDRLFADWAMLHDPAKSLIWTQTEISDGAFDRATAADIRQVFETLAKSAKDKPPA